LETVSSQTDLGPELPTSGVEARVGPKPVFLVKKRDFAAGQAWNLDRCREGWAKPRENENRRAERGRVVAVVLHSEENYLNTRGADVREGRR